MQTELILTKSSNSTVRIHILDEADGAFLLTDFPSARFVMRASLEGVALITKSYGSSTTTTSEPTLRILDNYIEIDIVPSDTEDLDAGTYLADITFIDLAGKEFITEIFYVKLCSKVS